MAWVGVNVMARVSSSFLNSSIAWHRSWFHFHRKLHQGVIRGIQESSSSDESNDSFILRLQNSRKKNIKSIVSNVDARSNRRPSIHDMVTTTTTTTMMMTMTMMMIKDCDGEVFVGGPERERPIKWSQRANVATLIIVMSANVTFTNPPHFQSTRFTALTEILPSNSSEQVQKHNWT